MEASKTKKGLSVEYKFFSWCLENGINISQPLSTDSPYDCIVETPNGQLKKLQIKRGFLSNKTNNSFIVNLRSCYSRNTGTKTHYYTNNEIDGFISWFEEIPDFFFYIPVGQNKKEISICFKNRQSLSQNWYEDYIFDIDKI